MTIIWSHRAIDHLTSIYDYIAQDDARAARDVARRILEAVALTVNQPHIGRTGRITGTRELVVVNTPYVIPYRVRGERLEILAVFHGRQKWPGTF